MRLSKRLETIASLCQPANVLADVGCDHAYLSIHTVLNNRAERVVAMDLRPGPLKKAAENLKKYAVEDKVELRLGNGLEKLEINEADAILISGMGGMLICDILSNGLNKITKVDQLILQPQSELSAVRHFLHDNGFVIDYEKMCIDDGKYYTCIHAIRGNAVKFEKEYEYEYGKFLIDNRNEILLSFLNKRLATVEEILHTIENSGGEKSSDAIVRLIDEKENLTESIGRVQNNQI